MEDLTPLQVLIFLIIAGINGVVIANALLDVYIRPPPRGSFSRAIRVGKNSPGSPLSA